MTRPVTDLERELKPFAVISDYTPAGDQPAAIAEIAKRLRAGEQDVVLLGATGTGKSATTAWLIEELQRPTLVMAPNKTLAAQLAQEFRELLLIMLLSTLFRITTITSQRRMFLKRIPLLRKIRRLTQKLKGFGTQPHTRCSLDEMSLWFQQSHVSMVLVLHRNMLIE